MLVNAELFDARLMFGSWLVKVKLSVDEYVKAL